MVKLYPDTHLGSGDRRIAKCQKYNYLGVILDECMNLNANFNSIFKKYSYKIYQFGKIRKYIDSKTRVLLYKQTILPLVEYVSFMLSFNNIHDVGKLQKLQNSCLRFCYDVYNPRDMSVQRLHDMANISRLDERRNIQLMNIMYSLKKNNAYRKIGVRITRSVECYVFDIDTIHLGIYSKSPYCKGAKLWNELPNNLKDIADKTQYKNCIKNYLKAREI